MNKNGEQSRPEQPPQQPATWVIVGHCPACGSPLYSISTDFTVGNPPSYVFATMQGPMPPVVYRRCGCPPLGISRGPVPGSMKLGGSFQFSLDDAARAVLAARMAPGDDDDKTKQVPVVLPPQATPRPPGERPGWMNSLSDASLTPSQSVAEPGNGGEEVV